MIWNVKQNALLNETISKMSEGDTLILPEGVFFEKIKITKSNITIIGSGKNTIITNKDYYNKIHSDNKEYLTVRTYTMLVKGNNVTIKNLTIRNESVPNSIYGQAVALEVLGDNFICQNVSLLGAQDTLLAGPLPYDLTIRYKDLLPKDELETTLSHQLYENCYIEGDVDYIFGCGIAYFSNCHLHSIGKGYISAPSHPQEYKYGFVFKDCLIDSENTKNNSVYFARPWRDYGTATFINCKVIGDFINKEIFHNWNKDREKTTRLSIYNSLDTKSMVKFAKELTKDEADKITRKEVLGF